MSLLFPLFLGGIAAVGLPVLFHFIRRTPSGRMPFSSLMFLRKSPPRFVRRNRVEHRALLALRALILLLLALAFARPYWRTESSVDAGDASSGPVTLLVDTSASMRRPGVWEAAVAQVESVLSSAPTAKFSLVAFDTTRVELVRDGSAEWVRERMQELEPSWRGTNLDSAMTAVADELATTESGEGAARIVLVSDLQAGATRSGLETYEWPSGVELELRRAFAASSNASLHRVPFVHSSKGGDSSGGSGAGAEHHIRVANAADSTVERFRIQWADATGTRLGDTADVYCPAGETRVVRAPVRPASGTALVLDGDEADFDNVVHFAPEKEIRREVLSYGEALESEQDLDFFLASVFGEYGHAAARSGTNPDVVQNPLVVARLGSQGVDTTTLLSYAKSGGVVLGVLAPGDAAAALAPLRELLGAPELTFEEADAPRGFALLGEIDFTHALFAPFADPRYRDFTKIHFWRHRRVDASPPDGVRVVASFESGAPYLLERNWGAGRVFVATSGWEATDTDLARSSKFAPLLKNMARLGAGGSGGLDGLRVGDRVPFVAGAGARAQVRVPDGSTLELEPGAEAFTETQWPGVYELSVGGRTQAFAVGLDAKESRTAPADEDLFARIGASVTRSEGEEPEDVAAAKHRAREERERQELGSELENRQKLWRWLVLAAALGLLVETTWAGRLAHERERSNEESAS